MTRTTTGREPAVAARDGRLYPTKNDLPEAARREVIGLLNQRLADCIDLQTQDRKSTRLNSSHLVISYAVFCLKKKTTREDCERATHALSSTLERMRIPFNRMECDAAFY